IADLRYAGKRARNFQVFHYGGVRVVAVFDLAQLDPPGLGEMIQLFPAEGLEFRIESTSGGSREFRKVQGYQGVIGHESSPFFSSFRFRLFYSVAERRGCLQSKPTRNNYNRES